MTIKYSDFLRYTAHKGGVTAYLLSLPAFNEELDAPRFTWKGRRRAVLGRKDTLGHRYRRFRVAPPLAR